MRNKKLDPLFEIIKKETNQSKRALIFLGLPVLLLVVYGSVKLFSSIEAAEITTKLVLNYLLFIFCIGMMFGIGFYSIKKRENFYKRKDFQWFIKHPEDVISYQIIAGGIPKIELIGENNKSTFIFNSSELEAEKILKRTFPNIEINKKRVDDFLFEEEILETQKVNKNILLQNIPADLKIYFLSIENYKTEYYKKKKYSIFLMVFVLLVFLTSAISFFTGFPDFFIFGYRSISFYILIVLSLIFILFRYDDYKETKEWLIYFQKKQSEIIWIYPTETQNSINGIRTGKTKAIYVCNSKGKKLYVLPFEDLEYTYFWLTSYFDNAISGFSYEYESLYTNQPHSFVQQIKNRRI
ncbi:hypothetical protein [Flavobacterium sp. I3-2]|uniref:hypothetical protein n=1 Tax=Flavobacterium sp. I3-2 TaxID=2748319 RepID=UPI0015AF4FE1|nr:hypothetical protein [Flavobacterium sp. I3-2]